MLTTVATRTPEAVLSRDAFARVPRLGWAAAPTPVTSLADLASALGLASLTVKRDDLCPELLGGSKVRKLDLLLATAPFATAPAWSSLGAIGSGHVLTSATAASVLGHRFHAHVFWRPPTPAHLASLAAVAAVSERVAFRTSRPLAYLGYMAERGVAHVPPGGTCPAGIAGMVRAGLELGEQVRAGLLPPPDRVYVALGSGGIASGLAVGLGLAGLSPRIHAIAVVERVLSPAARLSWLVRGARAWVARAGVPATAPVCPFLIDRRHLGRGYGLATSEALAACAQMRNAGLELEPVYTGKAMAALLADAPRARREHVLFWQSAGRAPPPPAADWRARLPAALARRVRDAEL